MGADGMIKTGVSTSEFWIVVANVVATVLLNAGIIEPETAEGFRNMQAGAIGMAMVSVAYVLQRGYVKAASPAGENIDPVADLRAFRAKAIGRAEEELRKAELELVKARERYIGIKTETPESAGGAEVEG